MVDSATRERVKMYRRGEKQYKGRTMMENLPADVIGEILSHLPLKTLLRCRSVCKLWRFLISSHPIILSRCGQGFSSGFFVSSVFWSEGEDNGYNMAFIRGLDEDMTRSYVDVRFFLSGVYRRDALYTKPLSICNGLIFYRSVRTLSEPEFYICNPETKERVAVPNFNTKEIYYVISGLAFDPAIPNRNGCNVASYKLVVGSLKRQLRFKVYCSSTRAWREPSSSCYPEPRCYRRLQVYPPSIFYHGVLHWLVDVDCLLTFDPELEISRWVETPNGGDCKTTGWLRATCPFGGMGRRAILYKKCYYFETRCLEDVRLQLLFLFRKMGVVA